ncbi:unnamed protein product [Paramecium primaurelia]|uniref:B30.2/SPRY domain-containing protein n=1 Tax=Paramecium primaurelia TaxID=5886 RepID=A0A8S1QMG0_PARPR|nr:unnamed protein product [Paramecium primaurelia]
MEQSNMKMCSKHKLEIVLVDLEAKVAQEDRYLCVRCIIERMNKKKMNMIDETKNLIKEMKMTEQNQKFEDNKKRLDNFKIVGQLLRDLKQNIDSIFDKIFNNIQSKLSQIQSDIENIESQTIIFNFEVDIERLSQYQEQQINSQSIQAIEDDHKFIEQIQKQLSSFINSQQYNKLMNNQIIFVNEIVAQDLQTNEQPNEMIKAQDYKTPALKLICEEHTKEIIMFNLNVNSNQQPKMACVKCIQQYPASYTPLEELISQWDQYQKRNQAYSNEIQKTRSVMQQKILKVIQDIKLQNDQIFDDLIQSLNNQQQSIEHMNQNQINGKSFYQLTSNQINEILIQLSQIDKFKSHKDQKSNIEKIDKIFYSDLRSRLEHLIQYQQINAQRINYLLMNDNKVIHEIDNLLKSTQQEDVDNKEETADILQIIEKTRQIMEQSFNFQFSQKILDENIGQYKKAKEEIQNLRQILSLKIEKCQRFQQIFNELNNYSEKFVQDYLKFQQFLEFDQMLNLIKELKEQISLSNNEQLIINQQNEEQKQQLELLKKNQNQYQNEIQVLTSLNEKMKKEMEEQINHKNQDNKKLKEKIESIQKENSKQKNQFENDLRILNQTNEQINKENLELKNQIKVKDEDFQELKTKSSQQQKLLTFSQTHKHSNCQVTQNGKTVQNGKYCLCDQVIPKNGFTLFAFKIIELSSRCFIGIGMREIIQKNNYDGDVTYGYGSYTIGSNQYCFSHHDKDKDAKALSFDFTVNDIIMVEVDIQNKYIKWTKKQSNQSFTLQIDTTYDLYPCVWAMSGSKIEIQDIRI